MLPLTLASKFPNKKIMRIQTIKFNFFYLAVLESLLVFSVFDALPGIFQGSLGFLRRRRHLEKTLAA